MLTVACVWQDGDVVGLMRTADGRLWFYVNGLEQGVAARKVPDEVYGVIDLYGRAAGVCLAEGTCCSFPSFLACFLFIIAK